MKNTFKKLAVLTACLFTGASALVLTGCDFNNGGEVTDVTGLTAKSIAITTLPTKTTYKVGETFDKTGIKVTATFTNGKKGDVSDLVSFSNTEFKTAGKQQIGVAYQTAMASFEVTVEAKSDGGNSGEQGGEQGGEGGEETQYTESDIFPAEALQEFLTTLGLTTTVPAPTGVTTKWYYTSGMDNSGNYIFETYTEDSGTPGTNAIEDSYKTQLTAAGWQIDDSAYDTDGYYANKGDVTLCFFTYEGEFVIDVMAASTAEISDVFPAQALQAFLTSEGLTTTVPSPVSSNQWAYEEKEDADGKYFYAYTEDAGTPGTNAIEDTYKATLLAASWTIDNSLYDDYGYYANKGDVEIQFYSYDGEFIMYVYAADGSGQGGEGGGDTPTTDTITCAQAITIAKGLSDNETTTETYKVEGIIASSFEVKESDKTAGTYQFNIADADSDTEQLVVWWGSCSTTPKQGDHVIVEGKIQKYVSGNSTKYELKNSTITIVDGGSQGGGDTPVQPEPKEKAAWTVMIYMCGADLESASGYSYATDDIKEILKVSNQPDDVNIIIETGGCSNWKGSYGIKNNELGRWHVENKQLVKDNAVANASMGLQSTFESFLNWGLTYYPADKVGVILWNHGGSLSGCCFDENFSNDSLTNSEVKAAFQNVLGSNKLEFIGYDACLMQVQDIADYNSNYFKYMVGAEEAEAGDGWAYDKWVDDLYAKKDTTVILKEICDGFVDGFSSKYPQYDNDQTQSYLDLTKMAAYRESFETVAASIKDVVKTSAFNTFLINNVKHYADTWMEYEDYQDYITNYGYAPDMFVEENGEYCLLGYYDYALFDAKDFLTQLKSNTTLGLTDGAKTNIQNALTALEAVIGYNRAGDAAGESYGLAMVCPADDWFATKGYQATETNFVTWRNAVTASGRSY